MELTVREATTADAPSLGVLRSQAIETACSDVYDRTAFADLVANARTEVADWIDDGEATVLLAETPITPVGYVAFGARSGRIHSLCTSPDHWRDGVATTLLDHVGERVREAGGEELRADVPAVAREFFLATGFRAETEAEWHGLPAETMVRRLA